MPKKQEQLNNDLFQLLKIKGYDPIPFSSDGKQVPTPFEADVFQFRFKKDGEDYGPVTVTVDGSNDLGVYYSADVAASPKAATGPDGVGSSGGDPTWYQLLKQLKVFAKNHQLGFDLKDQDNLKYDMAKREHTKKLDEGYHAINKKASYNDNIAEVKMVIKHKREMQEGEQRFRQIERIFIENVEGERFLAPTNKPGLARVYARHIAEGGKANDERWNHIGSICEEYTQMAGFVRATKNNQFNESTQRLVNEGINHYTSLRETLHKLAGKKGYNNYFESYTPKLMEDESQVDLSEMFMSSSLDPRIESVMPILRKLSKNISETSMPEVTALAEWADNIIEADEGIASNNPGGMPESVEPVDEAKGLHKKVKIIKGPDAGKIGWIRQVEHGQYKGAPKKYDVDIEGGGQANGLPSTSLRLIKDEQGLAEAATEFDASKIDPNEKCKTCGTSFKKHFTFDDNGNITHTLVRHMQMKDDFPGMPGLDKGSRPNPGTPETSNLARPNPTPDLPLATKIAQNKTTGETVVSYNGKLFALPDSPYAKAPEGVTGERVFVPAAAFGIRSMGNVIAMLADDGNAYAEQPVKVFNTKHKKAQGVAEAGDTAKGQKQLAKVHHRAADRVTSKQADKDPEYARKAQQTQDRAWDRLAVKEQGVTEGMDGQTVFSGTGDDGGKYEIIQTGPTDFMIHANGKHIDTYSSLARAMSVLKNEVSGLKKDVAEDLDANQKRVGQLGPTEKITKKNPLRGKLVGANENFIGMAPQAVAEGQEDLDTIRRLVGK